MKLPKTAIVKVTNGCNLACEYCYAGGATGSDKMPLDLAEKFLVQFGEMIYPKRPSIIWHGGEPLIMGIDFYENIAWMQSWLKKTKNLTFDNSIQTNGTLVTPDWINFCKINNWDIGFSLDGPDKVNGLTRKYPSGNNAFKQIFRGIELSKEAGISNGAIVVLNKANLPYLDEIYDFFRTKKMGLKLNPLIHSGNTLCNLNELGLKPKEFGQAMIYLFDRYFYEGNYPREIEPFDSFIGNISTGNNNGTCSFSENCQQSFFSINYSGEIYPCGRFDNANSFLFGDMKEKGLKEILEKSVVRKKLLKRNSTYLNDCKNCDFRKLCNSGCLNNAYMIKGDVFRKDYYCDAYKMLFIHISESIDKELEKARIK